MLCVKAYKVTKKRNLRVQAQIERLKADALLRRDFACVTHELIASSPDRRLIEGIAMNVQLAVEDAADMIAAFEPLAQEKKLVYTLEYFIQDAGQGLSEFFMRNGRPLITLAPVALKAVGADELAAPAAQMLPMCDDEDESVSVDKSLREAIDAEFKGIYNQEQLVKAAADYIRKNAQVFVLQ